MSDQPFMLPPVPLMTPDKARDIARMYQAIAAQFEEAGSPPYAARETQKAQWWLTYALVLAQRAPE